MSIYEDYDKYREALRKIANFGHVENCEYKCVPIYECCCFEKAKHR